MYLPFLNYRGGKTTPARERSSVFNWERREREVGTRRNRHTVTHCFILLIPSKLISKEEIAFLLCVNFRHEGCFASYALPYESKKIEIRHFASSTKGLMGLLNKGKIETRNVREEIA